MADISSGGCNCILTKLPPYLIEMFNSQKQVLLEFELPGIRGKKGLFGEVLNVSRDGAKIALGIKFNGNDDVETLEELSGYILKVGKFLRS